jgi:two-component system OmpR family response regulator
LAFSPSTGNYDILLVDDQPIYHDVVRAILESRGFAALSATSGEAAIEAAEGGEFALILMDVDLPGLDGYATAARIRKVGEWAAICPIIAFTTGSRERGPADKVTDDHLAKPFTATELLRMIDKWMGAIGGTAEHDPTARLATLLGPEATADLVDRFHAQLETASLSAARGDEDVGRIAHRIGGLAGTLGYAALSAAWLAVEHGAAGAIDLAQRLSGEALTRHDTHRARAKAAPPADD